MKALSTVSTVGVSLSITGFMTVWALVSANMKGFTAQFSASNPQVHYILKICTELMRTVQDNSSKLLGD